MDGWINEHQSVVIPSFLPGVVKSVRIHQISLRKPKGYSLKRSQKDVVDKSHHSSLSFKTPRVFYVYNTL